MTVAYFQLAILPETCWDPPWWRWCCCHWLWSSHENYGMRFPISTLSDTQSAPLPSLSLSSSYAIIQDWDCSREMCAQNENDKLNPPEHPNHVTTVKLSLFRTCLVTIQWHIHALTSFSTLYLCTAALQKRIRAKWNGSARIQIILDIHYSFHHSKQLIVMSFH